MPASLPHALERWLRDPSHREVEATWVPGLTARERSALFAVGGVARGLLAADQVKELPAKVRRWMNEAPTPPSDALELFRQTIERGPDEAFASLYSVIVSRAHRRQLGTFFTPSDEVKLMLDLWMEAEQSPPRTIVVQSIAELLRDGSVRPVIAATFPLKDGHRGHELGESGHVAGKIVLTV